MSSWVWSRPEEKADLLRLRRLVLSRNDPEAGDARPGGSQEEPAHARGFSCGRLHRIKRDSLSAEGRGSFFVEEAAAPAGGNCAF